MASLVTWLKYSGARKVDGTPVSSGRAFFYVPGTTSTQIPVYSDPEGVTVHTQPVLLDAAGRATVYITARARIEVQEAVTNLVVSLSDLANTVTGNQVEVLPSAYFPPQASLTTALDYLAQGVPYQESAGATPRTYISAMSSGVLTFQDFGAVGDGIADDTAALLATLTRQTQTRKEIRILPGTYNTSSSLTISQPGAVIRGVNSLNCIIRNTNGGVQSALYVALATGPDNGVLLESFTVDASPLSPAAGIYLGGGDGAVIRDVRVKNHRTGIATNDVSLASIEDCVVHSTDNNAAGIGIALGPRSTAIRSRVLTATNGKGMTISTLAKAIHCHVDSAVTGFEFIAGGSQAIVCQANSCTNGFLFSASDAQALMSACGTCTNGFVVGAVARSGPSFCGSTNATADLLTSASASEVVDNGNTFAVRTLSEYGGNSIMGARGRVYARSRLIDTTAAPVPFGTPTAWTPDPRAGELQIYMANGNMTGGDIYMRVQPTATTGLRVGQSMRIIIGHYATAGAGTFNFSWTTASPVGAYAGPGGGVKTLAHGEYSSWHFVWTGSLWSLTSASDSTTVTWSSSSAWLT